MQPFTAPSHDAQAFNCPHCNAFANQRWSNNVVRHCSTGQYPTAETRIAECMHCQKYSFWVEGKLIYPLGDFSGIPEPNSDLLDDIRTDFLEAKAIFDNSPKGAAAMLRLCVQKLCEQLGEKGKNINDDIADLVRKGLPVRIQQSLDIVRVIGNNSVHPGQIDINDDPETARELFALINLIAEVMITQPKQIDALYNSLPQSAKDAIQKRDRTQ